MKGGTVGIAVAFALGAAMALARPVFAARAIGEDGCDGVRTASAVKLVVVVNGVRSSGGEVAVTVYPDDKRRFLAKGGKIARERVRAGPSIRSCFWLPPGAYAVAVYHDSNRDRDFNRTLVGLPAEGFGFSNDPETRVGLPSLSSVRFRIAQDTVKAVRMKYLK